MSGAAAGRSGDGCRVGAGAPQAPWPRGPDRASSATLRLPPIPFHPELAGSTMADFKTHIAASGLLGIGYGGVAFAVYHVPLPTCVLAVADRSMNLFDVLVLRLSKMADPPSTCHRDHGRSMMMNLVRPSSCRFRRPAWLLLCP